MVIARIDKFASNALLRERFLKIAKSTLEENLGAQIDVRKCELKNVNGNSIIRGTFNIDLSGIPLIFDSYYFGNTNGTIQVTTWTGKNEWSKSESTILDLLNGLIVK